ncbi:MAG: hypothetical protein QXU40_01425 [Candidatus Pacearchaeota archaeon]
MEFTKSDLQEQSSVNKLPIPEGENTLWIIKFKTRRDEEGNKIKFPRKTKRRNIKEANYFYVTEFELADKDNTGGILDGIIYWNENDKIDYLDFARAGNAEVVVIDEGKKTERYRMEPENRADDDTIRGIVGRAVKVHVSYLEKELTVPKKDEAGNIITDPITGKWVMEVVKDSDGKPRKIIKECITRDSNWRFLIQKSENEELFFPDENLPHLDLEEPNIDEVSF